MVQHVYFPQSIIELQEEVQSHNQLLINLLQLPKDSPIELKIGEIAAYCDVVLDGYYGEEEIDKLCDILVQKLKQKRGQLPDIYVPPSPRNIN